MIDIELADRWRACPAGGAGASGFGACSRQSFAVIEGGRAACPAMRRVGGYVAAEAAADRYCRRDGPPSDRSSGCPPTTSCSPPALVTRWTCFCPRGRVGTLACPAGEYRPNPDGHRGGRISGPPVGDGSAGPGAGGGRHRAAPTSLPGPSHRCASHRGVVQPIADMAEMCRRVDVPLVVDAAQAFGQVDCDVGADAVYSSSRKWMAGPRGWVPGGSAGPATPGGGRHALESIAAVEANVAARGLFDRAG